MEVSALFLDVGGVLGTNGWDRAARQRAARQFGLDYEELNERHHLTFDTYEMGKLDLAEYLDRVVFYEPRPFTKDAFRDFLFDASRPYPEMIALVKELRATYGLRVAVVSNEGRELAEYRVRNFGLVEFVDFFIFSSFVHFRKPDADIFRLALDVAQIAAHRVVYLEDRPMFVQVAEGLGLQAIHHTGLEPTRSRLAQLGLASAGQTEDVRNG